MAVYTLPPEMIGFYKQHIVFLSEHAVDADKRRHSNEKEAPRHYIDMEYYNRFNNSDEIDSIPFNWKEAIAKYSEDSLNAWGRLPWTIKHTYYLLINAFKEANKSQILQLSADLGHYLSDAHVPLHTTINYNGQLTGQKGIHALWETKIPELEAEGYNFMVGKAVYIQNLDTYIRKVLATSNKEKDMVLLEEKQLSDAFATDKKHTIIDKYNGVKQDYSDDYITSYSNALDGMVERKMQHAVLAIGSLWYTAWVNAGQPNLKKIQR